MFNQWTVIAGGVLLLFLLLFFSLFLLRKIQYHTGIEGMLRRRHKGCTVRQYPQKNTPFTYYVCKKTIENSRQKEVWLYVFKNKKEIQMLSMPLNEVPELWVWKQVNSFEMEKVPL